MLARPSNLPHNDVFVSAASPSEIAIKARKGKLAFTGSVCRLIADNGFLACPLPLSTGRPRDNWRWEHPDPFDRLLVVQSLEEELVLVHADAEIRAYKAVSQLWAREDG